MSYVPEKQLRNATILFACFFVAGAMLLAFVMGGCAASNLSKPAQVNKTITTAIADGCTVAVKAKSLYEAGTIPQTPVARTIINDATTACQQAKTAFTVLLNAEIEYRNAEVTQVGTCTPQPGFSQNVEDIPGCKAAGQATATAKIKVDGANAGLDAALATMTAKAGAANALVPKQ
jgi:hypothetical protein